MISHVTFQNLLKPFILLGDGAAEALVAIMFALRTILNSMIVI